MLTENLEPENWITFEQALRFVGDATALQEKVRAGAIGALPKHLHPHQLAQLLPARFWFGEAEKGDDWISGNFSRRVDGQIWTARGVRFAESQVLKLLPPERRASAKRLLSVTADPAWVSTSEARRGVPEDVILEQAKLGFLAARAVLAQWSTCIDDRQTGWTAQAREWDVPTWFWTEVVFGEASTTNWDTGVFEGPSPRAGGTKLFRVSGLHFDKAGLENIKSGPVTQSEGSNHNNNRQGRPKLYDWESALIYLIVQAEKNGIAPEPDLPGAVAKVSRMLEEYFERDGGCAAPGKSQLDRYAGRIIRSIRETTAE